MVACEKCALDFRVLSSHFSTGMLWTSIQVDDVAADNWRDAACAVKHGGQVTCWGTVSYERLCAALALTVFACSSPSSSLLFKKISISNGAACGVLTSGGISCWGT